MSETQDLALRRIFQGTFHAHPDYALWYEATKEIGYPTREKGAS